MEYMSPLLSTPPPGPRDARFVQCIDTGRWRHGQPEQLTVEIVEHKGTMLLGVHRQVRQWGGVSAAGFRKPDKFVTLRGGFYYNLGDSEQLEVLFNTLRHIEAYSVGLDNGPSRNPYWMKLGERKTLTETPLRLKPDLQDVKHYDSFEQVQVLCENRNYRHPGHAYYARNTEIRDAYRADYRRLCRPEPRYTFKVQRRCREHGIDYQTKGYTTLGNATVSIPAECAQKFCAAVQNLIQYVWSYLIRHPEQSDIRYLPWRSRWQLHFLPTFKWLIPRIQDACLPEEEPALFTRPDLYLPTRRFCVGADETTPVKDRFTKQYLDRLFAYGRGELKWKSAWEVHELQAMVDLEEVSKEVQRHHYILAKTYLGCMVLLLTLVDRHRTTDYCELTVDRFVDASFWKAPVRGYSGLGRAPPGSLL